MAELNNGDKVYAVVGGEVVEGEVRKADDNRSAFNVEVDGEIYGGFAEGDKGVDWAHEKDKLV